MLLAEERLDLLIERLREMSARDRGAVLRLLPAAERRRVERLLRLTRDDDGAVTDGFSLENAARIGDAQGSARMTAAGREALARAVARRQPAASPERSRSLLDAAAAFARRDR